MGNDGAKPDATEAGRVTATEQKLVQLEAEVERLRQDCAEAYQVVGALAGMAGVLHTRDVEKALDNLQAAAVGEPRPHEDLLPFVP